MVEELLDRQIDAEAHDGIVGPTDRGRKFFETGVLTCGAMKRQTRIGERALGYTVVGEGRAVILVHAFPLDGRMWQDTAAALADRCRVIAPDMRGFGASDLGHGSHSIADMADDVAALMDSLGIAKATVGGLSMGGYVSLAFAARHRARLEGLILADTRAAADSEAARAARVEALALVEAQGVAAYVERQLAALLSASASDEVRNRVRSLGQQKPDGVCAGILALRDRPDRRAELSAIGCPTLVIVGSDDKISPPAEMADIARAISGSRLAEIAGAGHLCNLEKPAEFLAAVANFI
jgi:3-oxoadipate enol-lactonase